ncbi:MAG: tRNA (N(6)-L-threonylcarbamoyladenosine(37)-C(2))-methylthiotransferase MtaB [Eubacteriaceae bacterium]
MKEKKKVAFMTLGCKVNSYDSEAMMEIFENNQYEIVDFSQPSDVYVVNTCTVTHLGDRKSRNMLRKAKRLNPDAIICAVGCYVQASPDEVKKIDEVDLMIGTKNRGEILKFIRAHEEDKSKRNFVTDIMKEGTFEPLNISESKGKTRAFIKIQEGCNQFCTYCIVPFARGPVRSRPMAAIIDEVERVVKAGYEEIVLTGIHIASYGVDPVNPKGEKLIELLEALDKITQLKRVRLGSLEPKFITEDILDRLLKLRTFCPHFHLSLQSGSQEVLKRMGRHYTPEKYLEIVSKIRERFPLGGITTDIMVGFPGETEGEFLETIAFVKKVAFYQIHVFKYSKRKGTKAAEYPDQIPDRVKGERSQSLSKVSETLEIEFLKKNQGAIEEVLIENKCNGYLWEGHTKNYIPVIIESKEKIDGKILLVKLSYEYKDKKRMWGVRFERSE